MRYQIRDTNPLGLKKIASTALSCRDEAQLEQVLIARFQAGEVLLVAVASALTLCSLAPLTLAQDAIRVQTNQVLVPVVVIDKERFHRLIRDPWNLDQAILSGDGKLVDAIASGLLVLHVTAADF